MNLLYQRTETDNEIVVVFRPYSMYVLLFVLLLLMAVTFVPSLEAYAYIANVLMPIAALVVIVRIVFMHKVNSEVRQAMRDDKVTISGGKLSASKPLTFVIAKK
ncbi:hypothetical protein ACFO4O_13115 [Glaciecola siphonariae]|uniref:Uncharacterized protein n=1 Tax=Glaciecola siphonariae TaxID=521012 RepID=A0ABV9LXA6_9ALTE